MHGYSTDSSERRFVPLLLAAVAVVCAWLCSKLMAAAHFSTPWWLDAPSSLAFYGVVNTLFDKHLWRNRLVRKLGLSRVPNLTGHWRGFLVSSFDGHVKRHDVLLQIFQSWTQISIYLTTITSMSRSCVAELQVSDPEVDAHAFWHRHVAAVRQERLLVRRVLLWEGPAHLRTNMVLERARRPCHTIRAPTRNDRWQAEGLIALGRVRRSRDGGARYAR